MKPNKSQAQMRRGVLELCILSIIKSGEKYPSEIIQEMKKAELNVVEGTLYPLLTRLKNAKLLSYRWQESESGPPRKYYHLTADGLDFLNELTQHWTKLVQSVNQLLENPENPQL